MFTSCWSAGVWPVWKAEAGISFLHLLFELLDTVQKGHHGVVKFIVPEEPQAPWAVQRKFLHKQKTEWKGQDWSLEECLNNDGRAGIENTTVYVLPWTCLSVTLSMSGFHMGQDDIWREKKSVVWAYSYADLQNNKSIVVK